MFDAARAVLLVSGTPVEAELARTHSGLIAAFSLHLVKPGRVPVELGRSLNRVERIRMIADYRGDAVELDQAAWAVEQSTVFVQAMRTGFMLGGENIDKA